VRQTQTSSTFGSGAGARAGPREGAIGSSLAGGQLGAKPQVTGAIGVSDPYRRSLTDGPRSARPRPQVTCLTPEPSESAMKIRVPSGVSR
jgi:hypothetical protein